VLVIAIAVLQFTHVFQYGWGRWLVSILAIVASACVVLSAIFSYRESVRREKRELGRDKRFEELVALFPKPRPTPDVSPEVNPGAIITTGTGKRQVLRERAVQLAHELFAFLREKGPKPEVEKPHKYEETEDYLMRVMDAVGPWTKAIHHGYEAKFKERVAQLYHELEEAGIEHGLQMSDINPQVQNADNIRKIAETLFLVAARMDAEDAMKRTASAS